jgi:hypothetical protein
MALCADKTAIARALAPSIAFQHRLELISDLRISPTLGMLVLPDFGFAHDLACDTQNKFRNVRATSGTVENAELSF